MLGNGNKGLELHIACKSVPAESPCWGGCDRQHACHSLVCISWSFPSTDSKHGTNAAWGRWMCSSPGGAKASRVSVPQHYSPVCEEASGLKVRMFNCSLALSPAQHLAKQVCSGGVLPTGAQLWQSSVVSLLLAPTPSITSLLAEPLGSSRSLGSAFKEWKLNTDVAFPLTICIPNFS